MLETVARRYTAINLGQVREEQYVEEYMSQDEMDGLSDSQSTRPSHSRPTTPSDIATHPRPRITKSKSRSHSSSSASPEPAVFAVASKASHILGLVPGTLPHALACLESARDEARRLSDVAPISNGPASYVEMGGETKQTVGRMDRARKALSIAMPTSANIARLNGAQGTVPSVIMSIGGEEEETKRERRRKVADGVLHWQKEVMRLREEDEARQRQSAAVERKGTKKGRR